MTGISKQIVAAYTADLWEHVCPTIRISEPLQAAGFEVARGAAWTEGGLEVDLDMIPGADYVLIARDFASRSEQYAAIIEAARRYNKPVIYELDDLLVDLPAHHPDVDHYLPIKPGVIQAVVDADLVTVSTSGLAEFLRPLNPNIEVLPNCLVDRFWKFPALPSAEEETAAEGGRPVRIGYMGGHGHKPDLAEVIPVLERILEKYGARVELMFWGLRAPDALEGRENVRWTIPYLVEYEAFTEYFLSQSADIFIAPLRDNRFNRCKSALKYLEYSAFGVPGVYADLPAYRELITSGENGYLAATPAEWESALSALIEDAALRAKVGAGAQKMVREKHLLSANAQRWKAAYQSLSQPLAARDRLAERTLENEHLRGWYGEVAARFAEEKKARIAGEEALRLKEGELHQRDFELQHMTNVANSLRSQIEGIVNSRGWKALQKVYELRVKLLPHGSKRERLLRLGYKSLITLRREGPRALARKAGNKILGRQEPLELTQTAEHRLVNFSVEPGALHPGPLVSVVICRPLFDGDVEDVLGWVSAPANPTCEVVVWDTAEQQAWKAGSEAEKHAAVDFEALKGFLRGKYVCFASDDLLAQAPTYLLANVAALETEALAFTVNIHWMETGVVEKVQSGLLPGGPQAPLLRQVARKDCIGGDLRIDLSGYDAEAFAAGKFVLNETAQPDALQDWPYQPAPAGFELVVDGQWILGCREGKKDRLPVQHVIHPADTVLPATALEGSKPVILVLIQFMAVGGAERLHLELFDHMKDEFTFVIAGMERQASSLGTTADNFRKVTPYVYSLAAFLNPALNYSFLVHLIQRFQPKALYIPQGSTWIYQSLYQLHADFPALRMVHQVYDHQFGWINHLDQGVVSSLSGHIGANAKILDAYRQKGAPPEQIYLIDHCFNVDQFDPEQYSAKEKEAIKTRLGLPLGKRIVAFIGRIHPQKRPMDFVELSRRFASDPSIHFLMVGDGPLAGVVEEYVQKNQPANLTVRPFHKPVTEIFSVMDVMVLPSEYEAMPLVILEAQAMGKPVVVTDVGSNRSVVEDTGGGVVVAKIGDIKALSDGLMQVFAQPIDGARVREKTRERFNTGKIAAQYRAAFLGDQTGGGAI